MPKYLIAFNDEWVPEQTPDDLRGKSAASQAVADHSPSEIAAVDHCVDAGP